jgi:uncharacterized protein
LLRIVKGRAIQKRDIPQILTGEGFRRALKLFNRAEFFEAHEVWEDIWRPASEPEKKFLQGLIQIAVAFHHYGTGNLVGARSLLERGRGNLKGCPENFGGIKLAPFQRSLAAWQHALAERKPVPPLPQL